MLERCSLFIGVEPEEIAYMSDLGKLESFREGDRIIRVGVPGDTLYVLVEGSVSIRIGEEEIALAEHAQLGSFFGEIAIVDNGPRSASVIAEADSTLLRLPIDVLEDCFRGNSMMEARVMRNLATALSAYLLRANAVRVRS